LFSTVAAIITTSLTIQLIVLFLLIYGYQLKKKFRYRQHGFVMAAAVVLHLVIVLYIMIPSLVEAVIPQYIVVAPLQITSVVGTIHSIVGSTSIVLGVLLVATWRFNKDINGCFARRRLMLPTFAVWLTSLAFGIILYAIFIEPLITG
jgi:uncharacterized membrane protein YozB (DUF420 family)